MSDFTIENLRGVEDSAPKFGFDEIQEARFARGALDADATGLSYHRLKPGKRQGFGHRHVDAEEVYVVLSGSGRIKLDDELRDVGVMDAVRIGPGVGHAFEAGDEGLEYLAFGPHHEGEAEMIGSEEFWGS